MDRRNYVLLCVCVCVCVFWKRSFWTPPPIFLTKGFAAVQRLQKGVVGAPVKLHVCKMLLTLGIATSTVGAST